MFTEYRFFLNGAPVSFAAVVLCTPSWSQLLLHNIATRGSTFSQDCWTLRQPIGYSEVCYVVSIYMQLNWSAFSEGPCIISVI
jgi:hypothetical protein